MKDKLKDKKVKCRICNGEHFTARCPFKDTMAPVGEEGSAEPGAGPADAPEAAGGLGTGKSSYVPPHIRNGGGTASAGDRMGGGKYERDDLATLRVTNVSVQYLLILILSFINPSSGLGDGRGARVAGYVRALWAGHKSLPC